MPITILQVQLTTRIGKQSLDTIHITESTAAQEAGMARALYIGNCKKDRIVKFIANVSKNAHTLHTVIAASSYDVCDSIYYELSRLGVSAIVANKESKNIQYSGSAIYISIFEKLYLAKDWHLDGFRPSIIHIIDHDANSLQYLPGLNGETRCRAQNIAIFRAVYEARYISMYPIYWTSECCGCYQSSHIAGCLGCDAVQYGNGRTVRTTGFIQEDTDLVSTSAKSNILQDVIHDAFATRQNLIYLFSTSPESPLTAIMHFAAAHNYSLIDLSKYTIDNFWNFQSKLRKQLLELNRQIVILNTTESFWSQLQLTQALSIIHQACKYITIICVLPKPDLVPMLKAKVSKYDNVHLDYEPLFVDCGIM